MVGGAPFHRTIHRDDRNASILGRFERRFDGLRVDRIEDQDFNSSGDEILDVIVLFVHVAVGIQKIN